MYIFMIGICFVLEYGQLTRFFCGHVTHIGTVFLHACGACIFEERKVIFYSCTSLAVPKYNVRSEYIWVAVCSTTWQFHVGGTNPSFSTMEAALCMSRVRECRVESEMRKTQFQGPMVPAFYTKKKKRRHLHIKFWNYVSVFRGFDHMWFVIVPMQCNVPICIK